jgi:hypothetical protein
MTIKEFLFLYIRIRIRKKKEIDIKGKIIISFQTRLVCCLVHWHLQNRYKRQNHNFFSNKIVALLLDKDKEKERNQYKGQNHYFLSNKIVVSLGSLVH